MNFILSLIKLNLTFFKSRRVEILIEKKFSNFLKLMTGLMESVGILKGTKVEHTAPQYQNVAYL